MKSGCLKKSFFGCSAVFLFFFLIIILLLISAELPDIDFTSPEKVKREYVIEFDSLTNEKVINSSFAWKLVDNRLKKREFEISFRLLEKDVKEAMNFIEKLASMSYEELGLARQYTDPITESRVVWAEVYRRVYNNSSPQLKSVLEGFNKIFMKENFDARDKVYFVITFVQNIKYERPGGTLDLFPPLGTIAYRFGDCDSKAMLLYVILERMGIDCAMMWSYNYKHAMIGIKVNGRGNFLTTNGKKYYFLETTYPNWDVGEIPPEFGNTKFWFVAEIDVSRTSLESSDTDSSETETRKNIRPSPATPE
ncbi:MAG: hypothetical protein MUE91_03105 [Ignavibacteriaceae bacterium]|jgi:hypothetical protein|nr:hypothetical protein [Ignavibacteriaceae bacterium]